MLHCLGKRKGTTDICLCIEYDDICLISTHFISFRYMHQFYRDVHQFFTSLSILMCAAVCPAQNYVTSYGERIFNSFNVIIVLGLK